MEKPLVLAWLLARGRDLQEDEKDEAGQIPSHQAFLSAIALELPDLSHSAVGGGTGAQRRSLGTSVTAIASVLSLTLTPKAQPMPHGLK